MRPEEKDQFAETAYKRLFWQGYRGRFGVFEWPTTYGFGALLADDRKWKNGVNENRLGSRLGSGLAWGRVLIFDI